MPFDYDYDIDYGSTQVGEEKPGFFENLFTDPNAIRGIGELGGAIGGRGSVGEALGMFGSNMVRRRQLQQAAAGQTQRQKTFNERVLEALGQGRAISDPNDNALPDSINVTGDTVTIKSKLAPQPVKIPGEQMPLEAQGGISGLPDFF